MIISYKRFFDVSIILLFTPVVLPIIFLVSILIKCDPSSGPILYWSSRIGLGGKLYLMPKFRSMHHNTPQVATHELVNPSMYVTKFGNFLRKSSLDELPQLWSILIGDMSLVGPRPALFNQYDLATERVKYGIDKLLPGLTGLAQIKGRDKLTISQKIKYEVLYLKKQSTLLDLKILSITFFQVLLRENINH